MLSVDEQPGATEHLLAEDQRGFLRSCSPALRSGIAVLAGNLALTAVYVACGKFGLSLAFVHASASAVWPPTGVALAALLVWGYRLWPGVFLGAFLVNVTTQGSVVTSLGIAGGNTCEALVGAWLVCRFAAGLKAFERTGTFFRFVLFAGVVSTTLSPAIGVTSLCLGGFAPWSQYRAIWETWWLGDMVSNLILAPLLLIWLTRGFARLNLRQWLEAASLVVTVVLVGGVLFLAGNSSRAVWNYPLTYLAVPPLLWAAFRFGQRGAVTAAFVMDAIALWGTTRGWNRFAGPDPNTSLLFLQAFAGTASLTAVALASAVAERKAVEEQHRLSNVRLQAILDNSPAVIHVKDTQGRYILVNRRFGQLAGLGRVDIVGKSPHDLFPPAAANAFQEHDRTVLGTLAPLEFEETLPRDGEPRTYISVKFPLLDGTGVPYAVCGILTDITERKRAELALRQSEERLALVIQGSSDGVWDWDLRTNAAYFSARWKTMLGYTEHEVENHFSAWERLLHPADRERALASIQAYLSGQALTYELEHRLRHKDGSYRWILSRGVVLRDAQGKPVRMAGSHVDLTERKQAEEQLARAYAELSQSEAALKAALQNLKTANEELQKTQLQLIHAAKMESVGTLAAGVAHEVKNPLQIILMGLDYLTNNLSGGNDNTTLVLSDMRDAVTRANAIIRELLQLSAPTDFKPKGEDLNGLVERSLWLINSEVVASQITVVRKLDAELPPVMLDHSKLEQVFINLFINALQAMSQGGVLTVTTRQRRFGEDLNLTGPGFAQFKAGDLVVIAEVQDTGEGIPEHHLPRIFDPFFTTKPTGVGTGLGLSVVRKIMDLHGGAIDIRNRPLGGVVVTLLFRANLEENSGWGLHPIAPSPVGC
jgi:PAS domain S-box-containing protein